MYARIGDKIKLARIDQKKPVTKQRITLKNPKPVLPPLPTAGEPGYLDLLIGNFLGSNDIDHKDKVSHAMETEFKAKNPVYGPEEWQRFHRFVTKTFPRSVNKKSPL